MARFGGILVDTAAKKPRFAGVPVETPPTVTPYSDLPYPGNPNIGAGTTYRPEDWEQGVILPLERNSKTGELRPGTPKIVDSIIDAIMLPGEVLSGAYNEQLDPRKGVQPSPELIGRTLDAAGLMTGWTSPIVGKEAISVAMPAAKSGLSKFAERELGRSLKADGAFDGTGAANIAAAGKDGMLADVGANTAALLDTAVQHSGSGATIARGAVESRSAAANDQVTSTLDAVLGQPEGAQTLTKEIRDSTAEARDMAYKAAYGQPIDYQSDAGKVIEGLLLRLEPKDLVVANSLMRKEGVGSNQLRARIVGEGENADVVFEVWPDVRQLDYVTRALNQRAEEEAGKGALGAQTSLGRVYQNLARDIRGALKQAVPEYSIALDTAADPISRVKAVRFGTELLSTKVPRDVAQETIGGMSRAEVAAAKQGLRSKVDELVANVKKLVSDPNQDARQVKAAIAEMSSDAAREKITMLVGDQSAELFRVLDEAGMALELRASIARNSATFARTSLDQAVTERVAGGAGGQLLEGKPIAAGQRLVQGVTRRSPAAMRARKEKVYSEIATALVEKRGEEAVRLLRSLDPTDQRKLLSNSPALRLVALGATSGAIHNPVETTRQISKFVDTITPGPR